MARKAWIALGLVGLGAAAIGIASCQVPELGLQDGRLLPCPESPNCVCSLATDEEHGIKALPMHGDAEATMAALKEVIAEMPRTKLLEQAPNYLRFQFTSALMRYKDDLELHLVPAEGLVHVRSASRLGHSDLGANRKRVEELRERYLAWAAARAN